MRSIKERFAIIMLKRCEHYGIEIVGFSYKCKYCGYDYCLKHRLPENHTCMFTSSKGLVPEKLEVSGTYYQDSDVSKHYLKSKKVKHKKKQKKRKKRTKRM